MESKVNLADMYFLICWKDASVLEMHCLVTQKLDKYHQIEKPLNLNMNLIFVFFLHE